MNLILFLPVFLAISLFLAPKKHQQWISVGLIITVAILSSIPAFRILRSGIPEIFFFSLFRIDPVSAFFILVINLTSINSVLYSSGYLKSFSDHKTSAELALHHFSLILLHQSMLAITMLRQGLYFLLAWEMMTLSSFLLVIFDGKNRNILKTGINYLIQMHVGMLFLLVAFLILEHSTGNFGFESLQDYFSGRSNLPVFLLFFVGFGIKAGFIPFHSWLPEAHPAAPSHVSGLMSGVMIKMGIYGIFRVILSLQQDFLAIGIILLVISVISGLLGVMMAILQHDLKKLLAYHSIENIGIIGIGLALGVLGLHTEKTFLIITGFSGALLHTLNHSLFKSLLFFAAGSVYRSTHTRQIELLGGVIKKMPWTAFLFLLGALSICGLPPFNGFVSEFLIYAGLLSGLKSSGIYLVLLLMGALLGLVLIGGLAVFCFTKAFGIVFLGTPRSQQVEQANEAGFSMLLPQIIAGIFIVAIGMVPLLFTLPIFDIIRFAFIHNQPVITVFNLIDVLMNFGWMAGFLVLVVVTLWVVRTWIVSKRPVATGPTWGCGYTAPNSRLQYTATSFAADYAKFVKPVVKTFTHGPDPQKMQLFPKKTSFHTHHNDRIKSKIVDLIGNFFFILFRRIAVLQTGRIQHYIMYALIFIILIVVLTFSNLM